MLHEYWHVLKQWEARAPDRSPYVLGVCGAAYWTTASEIEARDFADNHRNRLHLLLFGPKNAGESPCD